MDKRNEFDVGDVVEMIPAEFLTAKIIARNAYGTITLDRPLGHHNCKALFHTFLRKVGSTEPVRSLEPDSEEQSLQE